MVGKRSEKGLKALGRPHANLMPQLARPVYIEIEINWRLSRPVRRPGKDGMNWVVVFNLLDFFRTLFKN